MIIRKVADDNGQFKMELSQDGANCFSVREYTPDGRQWSFVESIPTLLAANTRFDNNLKYARHHGIFYVND